MLLQIGSVHAAEQEERLLLMSDDLAWLMDVRIKADDSLQIGFLPNTLLLPIALSLIHICCWTYGSIRKRKTDRS